MHLQSICAYSTTSPRRYLAEVVIENESAKSLNPLKHMRLTRTATRPSRLRRSLRTMTGFECRLWTVAVMPHDYLQLRLPSDN